MTDESKLWNLLITSLRKAARLGIIIPIIFALTVVITALTGVFLPDTYEGSIQVMKIGLSIGFSMILVFYLITWFSCLAFLRETKQQDIADEKLRRLIVMNRVSCIIFMIPIICFVGLFGFFKVKTFAEEKVQKGTLDQILYHYFIDK
ncbi:hypothetical protein [Pseudogracilibacillus sp. SO30301A]|uniref:hypothetical protein n=1 Tax=Pseudogracilibacillus sp. SO30301A TaxID=3098291 RepID=UPI00300E21E5